MATKATDTADPSVADRLNDIEADRATPEPEGEVPVAAHVRRPPGTRQAPADRISDLEAELLRLQLAIVQADGTLSDGLVKSAHEYVTGWLDAVVAGQRKLPRELADHLSRSLKG